MWQPGVPDYMKGQGFKVTSKPRNPCNLFLIYRRRSWCLKFRALVVVWGIARPLPRCNEAHTNLDKAARRDD